MEQQLLFPKTDQMVTGAAFSPCRKWRYSLWRIWDDQKPMVLFIGLNPSTATEVKNDHTIARCIHYARSWGFGGLYMGNIFGYRATDPKDMKAFPEPVGAENDQWLIRMHKEAGLTVAAWGTHGTFLNRGQQVLQLLDNLHCLGLTKDNHPKHPSRLRNNLQPIKFKVAA